MPLILPGDVICPLCHTHKVATNGALKGACYDCGERFAPPTPGLGENDIRIIDGVKMFFWRQSWRLWG